MTALARNTDPVTSHEAADGIDLARSQMLVLCSIEGCEREKFSRGWCQRHYNRWWRNGDPLAGRPDRSATPEESFASRTRWEGECLVWTGAGTPAGYGTISIGGRTTYAHRYAWERVNGPIPDGAELDHTCYARGCCNVKHMRLASRTENLRNKSGPARVSRTGVRNVSPNGKGFAVRITSHRRALYFGTYPTVEEAARVAETKRRELFGDFAGRG